MDFSRFRVSSKRPRVNLSRYLKSAQWRRKRAAKLEESPACEVPGCDRDRLVVHHLTYERIEEERMSDLMTLCTYHHNRVHKIQKKRRITLLDATSAVTGIAYVDLLRRLGRKVRPQDYDREAVVRWRKRRRKRRRR